MSARQISIGLVSYPGCMRSAVSGLEEVFGLANFVCSNNDHPMAFGVTNFHFSNPGSSPEHDETAPLQVIIVPPNLNDDFYLKPSQELLDWLKTQHQRGSIICSVCAGAFILAEAGLLHHHEVTTHWNLVHEFSHAFPAVKLDIDKILINDGDIITAGGLMAWLDLGLELIAQFSNANVMREVGRILVVDTGLREQRYYQSFTPRLDHGDSHILKAQHFMQANFQNPITVLSLAEQAMLGERTFLRRFVKATGYKPNQYLQRLRIQKACDLLQMANHTVESISQMVGYEDTGAFRKTFIKIIGLTPKEFKNRFVNTNEAKSKAGAGDIGVEFK